MNLNDLIEEKLNHYAQKIVSGGNKTDEMGVKLLSMSLCVAW